MWNPLMQLHRSQCLYHSTKDWHQYDRLCFNEISISDLRVWGQLPYVATLTPPDRDGNLHVLSALASVFDNDRRLPSARAWTVWTWQLSACWFGRTVWHTSINYDEMNNSEICRCVITEYPSHFPAFTVIANIISVVSVSKVPYGCEFSAQNHIKIKSGVVMFVACA